MTEENTSAYYKQREQQERSLAAAATDPCARAAHLEMAERYATHTGHDFRGLRKPADGDYRAAIFALAASITKPSARAGSIDG